MHDFRSKTWLITAALATLATSGWASTSVQTPGQTPEEIAARRRAYEERVEAERKRSAEAAQQAPRGPERALYEQEQAHRLRLGRIARLRTLLRERGDTEKLAKLDELAAKENLRYQRFTEIQKQKLSKLDAERVDRGLARGRQRGEKGRPREAAAERERSERERAERERARDAKKPKQSPPAKPKPHTGDIH